MLRCEAGRSYPHPAASDAHRRAGSDLFYEKTLTLSEALCGFKFAIPHLDGRQLLVASNEGDVVKPGSFKAVYDEGMPTWQRPLDKGRLFIHFDVAFPEPGDLGDKEIAALADLLPPRPSLEVDIESCQEVSVSDIDMEQELRRQKERQMEEEDEEDPRGGRVQCAQQVRTARLRPIACDALGLTRSAARSEHARGGWTSAAAFNTRRRKPLVPCNPCTQRAYAAIARASEPCMDLRPGAGGALRHTAARGCYQPRPAACAARSRAARPAAQAVPPPPHPPPRPTSVRAPPSRPPRRPRSER